MKRLVAILLLVACCATARGASTSATWEFLDGTPDVLADFHFADLTPAIGNGGNNSPFDVRERTGS